MAPVGLRRRQPGAEREHQRSDARPRRRRGSGRRRCRRAADGDRDRSAVPVVARPAGRGVALRSRSAWRCATSCSRTCTRLRTPVRRDRRLGPREQHGHLGGRDRSSARLESRADASPSTRLSSASARVRSGRSWSGRDGGGGRGASAGRAGRPAGVRRVSSPATTVAPRGGGVVAHAQQPAARPARVGRALRPSRPGRGGRRRRAARCVARSRALTPCSCSSAVARCSTVSASPAPASASSWSSSVRARADAGRAQRLELGVEHVEAPRA